MIVTVEFCNVNVVKFSGKNRIDIIYKSGPICSKHG